MAATTTSSISLEDMAARVISTNSGCETTSKTSVCLAVAGGGGSCISALAATPGASSLFLEGTITYDRKSFQAYIGTTRFEDDDSFKFASETAARLLSRAAVRRCMQYKANIDAYPSCVGVGIASALVSTTERNGGSRGHVVATRADGVEWKCHVRLKPNSTINPSRRRQEDELLGKLALHSVQQLQTCTNITTTTDEASSQIQNERIQDIISLDDENVQEFTQQLSMVETGDVVKDAANQILNGQSLAVLLLPIPGTKQFMAMSDPVLPMESLVFPGSFNPPHVGHTKLGQAALHAWNGSSRAVFWELSLLNPDKPNMTCDSVSERAHAFFDLDPRQLPRQWGILLTSAPLFSQKVEILRPYMPTMIFDDKDSGRCRPQMGFVIGTDTMVRILNPKYYGNDEEQMLEAVREMGRSGVHFVVGGRLEQNTTKTMNEGQRFVSGQEELQALPKDIGEMFTLVTEEDFRVDISSSEIRQQRKHDNETR